MDRRHFTRTMLAAAGFAATARGGRLFAANLTPGRGSLEFDPRRFSRRTIVVHGQQHEFRAYEGLTTVAYPVAPKYQALNLYVPEAYFQGDRVGAYDAKTAPIFLPNGIGGYMPSEPGTLEHRGPAGRGADDPSASAVALSLGMVVAAPGARGRTLQTEDGRWIGKAPAAIVDLKAAVRWLRHNASQIPGNVECIISNGTSAGGAMSALLGASGNHPDYDADLEALGAAGTRDDVFAVSAFCPITNLPHADEAYEWQFEGIRDYRTISMSMLDFHVERREVAGQLSDLEISRSASLRRQFVAYVNRLGLDDDKGAPLTLAEDGSGSLYDHIATLLKKSAQQALDEGADLSTAPWVGIDGGKATTLDVRSHTRAIGRMKAQPAFDGLALETGENQLFGDATVDKKHFTSFSMEHSTAAGQRARPETVRAMDAMSQISDPRSTVAPHWRIRHGSADRDTSFAVPVLLAAAARQRAVSVDLGLPWGRPHSGDYELDALFDWVRGRHLGG